MFTPRNGGQEASVMGWSSERIVAGDYLILSNGTGTTRYQVKFIGYKLNPHDMFEAELVFAPRPSNPSSD